MAYEDAIHRRGSRRGSGVVAHTEVPIRVTTTHDMESMFTRIAADLSCTMAKTLVEHAVQELFGNMDVSEARELIAVLRGLPEVHDAMLVRRTKRRLAGDTTCKP